jgi:4-hydroxybenzoate polyprenyltransferase
MNTLSAWARLVRFPNLVIVALTQYLLQYAILLPALARYGLVPMLPEPQFSLLVLSTVLIAAGGYVINDIEDVEIDQLNKPLKKQIVGRIIPLSIASGFYWFLTLFGFFISLYLAFFIHDFVQLLIYPLAVGLLWWYSKSLKRLPLWGNLVVSFFCAFVAWVVFYAESLQPQSYQALFVANDFESKTAMQTPNFVFIGYAVFAFLSTLFREIVKDIEDADGDAAGNCRTFPIAFGIPLSKKLAFGVGVVFIGFVLVFSSFLTENGILSILILNIFVSLPMLLALYWLSVAAEKQHYSRLSKLAKIIMLSGVVFILLMKN